MRVNGAHHRRELACPSWYYCRKELGPQGLVLVLIDPPIRSHLIHEAKTTLSN